MNNGINLLYKFKARGFKPWFLVCLATLCLTSSLTHAQTTDKTRFIVKWKNHPEHTLSESLLRTESSFYRDTGIRLRYKRNLNTRLSVLQSDQAISNNHLQTTLKQLNSQDEVEYAVLDQRRYIQGVMPNDPLVTATSGRSGQWFLFNDQPAAINAFSAWDLSMGYNNGSPITVAVLDTGARYEHPDLVGKLLPGYDFVSCDQPLCTGGALTYLMANDGNAWDSDASDPGDWVSATDAKDHPELFGATRCEVSDSSWHGTRVAGIIGAAANNRIGIAGIGWGARILPVRVLGKCGGWDSDIIAGMQWAAGLSLSEAPLNPHPAKIINLSLGSASECNAAYADTINQLRYLGISVVASAGNDSALINTPANCYGVIAVVGVRHAGTKVGYSSLGSQATIAAPAGNCVNLSGPCLFPLDTTINLGTTTPGINDYSDEYDANLGTSFSAPVVSGTIALMLGANKDLTPDQIQRALQTSAKPFPQTADTNCVIPTSHAALADNESECNCSTSTCGAGLLDAYQAVITASQIVPNSGGGGSSDLLSWLGLSGLIALKRMQSKQSTAFGLI